MSDHERGSFLNFVEAVRKGVDPYKAGASERFQKPIEEVTPEERLEMKHLLMEAIYGKKDSFGYPRV